MGGASGVAGFKPARLIAARRRKGLTQQQLADLLGMNRGQVVRWESSTDSAAPRPDTLARIAAALGVTVEYLAAPGRTLAQLRQGLGVSQLELADRTGIPQSTLSALERGRIHVLRRVHAEAIAVALGVEVQHVDEAHRGSLRAVRR